MSSSVKVEASDDKLNKSSIQLGNEACTPKPTMTSQKGDRMTDSKKHETAKKIASLVKNPSTVKPKNQLQSSKTKSIKPSSVKRLVDFHGLICVEICFYANVRIGLLKIYRDTNLKKSSAGTPNLAQENQAIKRQKLEGGRTRQVNFYEFSFLFFNYYCFYFKTSEIFFST